MADINASTFCAERLYARRSGKFYTYIHITGDKAGEPGRVFYVGKGRKNRAWINRRGPLWHSIADEHGCKIEICAFWDSESDAHEHEKLLIACFRDMGIDLVNVTSGGGGISGFKKSPESKIRMSESAKARPSHTWDWARGESSPFKSLEFRQVMSEAAQRRAPSYYDHFKGAGNPSARAVVCVDTGQHFETMKDAARWLQSLGHLKASNKSICAACTGNKKRVYGYRWEYAAEADTATDHMKIEHANPDNPQLSLCSI